MITNRHTMAFAAMALMGSGLLVRDNGLSAPTKPAQTNAVDPATVVEPRPSRQVRRQRERLAAKGRR